MDVRRQRSNHYMICYVRGSKTVHPSWKSDNQIDANMCLLYILPWIKHLKPKRYVHFVFLWTTLKVFLLVFKILLDKEQNRDISWYKYFFPHICCFTNFVIRGIHFWWIQIWKRQLSVSQNTQLGDMFKSPPFLLLSCLKVMTERHEIK